MRGRKQKKTLENGRCHWKTPHNASQRLIDEVKLSTALLYEYV
jgi:hypothetical protein